MTETFLKLESELTHNEMVRSENFILDDTMQSYELFNKKTDFRMEMPSDFNIEKLFEEGVLKPASDLTLNEVGCSDRLDDFNVG